jgi:deoxycytidylate deaminase
MNKWRNRGMPPTVGYNPHLTIHAERDALSRVKDPRGATLYIAQVNRNGDEKMSRPCDACAELIAQAGIKAVVYTVS